MSIVTSSLSEALKKILYSDPLLSYSIKSGIANYSAVAKMLIPALEHETQVRLRVNTVVQALKRISVRGVSTGYADLLYMLGHAEYTLIPGVFEIPTTPAAAMDMVSQLRSTSHSAKLFIVFSTGDWSLVIMDSESLGRIRSTGVQDSSENSLLGIILPQSTSHTPGLTAFVAQVLTQQGVRIKNIIRSGNKIYVLFSKEDSRSVFEALSSLQAGTSETKLGSMYE